MITLFSILFSLITLFSPIVSANSTNPFVVSNENSVTTTNQIVDGFNNLEFNDNEHYLGLDEATNIAVTSNNLYFTTDTTIYNYNLTEKQISTILELENISELKATTTNLFALSNNVLHIIDLSNKSEIEIANVNMFSIYEDTNVYLSYIYNNTFNFGKVSNNTFSSQFTIELNSSFTPISITNNSTNSYVVINQNNISKILNINHNEENIESNTNYLETILDESHIIYAKNYDNTPLFYDYADGLMFAISNNDYTQPADTKLFKVHGEYGFEADKFYKVKDYTIYNNKLYILDSVYYSIQCFDFVEQKIEFDSVLTSSSGYTAGRFYKPNSFKAQNKNTLLVSDTYNKAIQIINGNTATMYKSYNVDSVSTPFEFTLQVLSNDVNYYVLQKTSENTYEVLILDSNLNLIEKINHNLTSITSIALNQNELYIADSNSNKIYSYKDQNLVELSSTTINFTVTENTKLDYILEINTLVALCDSKVYLVNLSTNSTSNITLPSTAISISFDYLNNLYVLLENKIIKYELSDTSNYTDEITLNTKYSNISIEKETGFAYLYNDKNQNFVILSSNKIESLANNFNQPVDLLSYTNEEIVNIAKSKENVYVYDYPYNNGSYYTLNNSIVYILDDTTYSNYYYVCYKYDYYIDNNPTKLSSLKTGYILKEDADTIEITTLGVPAEFEVISDTKIYSLPTLLKYNNENLIVGTLTSGTYISSNYIKISGNTLSIDNCNFYIIEYNDKIAYVKEVDLLNITALHTENILKCNAKISVSEDKYNTVYVYAGNDSFIVGKLLVGTKIYVENYNINSKYTYIRYLDENNREHGGYILTKCIKMDSNKTSTFPAIILITFTILIIGGVTTFYIISYKKQQKNLNNNNNK